MNVVKLEIGNLSNEAAWALKRLEDFFCNPDKERLLRRWLEGRAALAYCPDTGLLSCLPLASGGPPGRN
jgi:hypothetical protein